MSDTNPAVDPPEQDLPERSEDPVEREETDSDAPAAQPRDAGDRPIS